MMDRGVPAGAITTTEPDVHGVAGQRGPHSAIVGTSGRIAVREGARHRDQGRSFPDLK